jgi:hypothetical protein
MFGTLLALSSNGLIYSVNMLLIYIQSHSIDKSLGRSGDARQTSGQYDHYFDKHIERNKMEVPSNS